MRNFFFGKYFFNGYALRVKKIFCKQDKLENRLNGNHL